MNYAIFCYREDHQCLGLCLEQIRSIDRAAQFYLFDDAAKPLFPAQVPAGNDISYKITYFARRGNLNGLECVRGMLGCMLDIPGDDPVIKIDADTLLMDPAEIIRSLKDRGKVAGGMQCSVPLAWAGCCYWLTRHQRCLQRADAPSHQGRAGTACPAGMAGKRPSGISGR